MKKLFTTLKSAWMRFARKLGEINTIALLFLFYYYILGWFGLGARLFRRDLLDRRMAPEPSFWRQREGVPIDIDNAQRLV